MHTPRGRTHKKTPFILFGKGRRANSLTFVVPPSFGAASQQHPRRVQTYSRLLTGASGKALLSQHAISARSSGFLFTGLETIGFPPTAHSLDAPGTCYSSLRSCYAILLY